MYTENPKYGYDANVPGGNIAVLAASVVNPQISKTVVELFLNPLIGKICNSEISLYLDETFSERFYNSAVIFKSFFLERSIYSPSTCTTGL